MKIKGGETHGKTGSLKGKIRNPGKEIIIGVEDVKGERIPKNLKI